MKYIFYFIIVILGIILKNIMLKNNPGIDTYCLGFLVGIFGGFFLFKYDI